MKELTTQARDKIQSLLNAMTLRELIGQTAIWHIGRVPFAPDDPAAVAEFLAKHPVGSIFVADMKKPEDKTMARHIADCVSCFQKAAKIPLLVSGDLERGGSSVAKELTRFPDMMAIGAANDLDLDYRFGKYTALDGNAMGINWTFSPVVDMSKNWLNPIVSNRSLGDDPTRVAEAGAAIIAGLQEHGMAACAKHFPGDGVDFHDQHICTSINSLPEEEWFATYGAVYKKVIDCDVASIMIGHIALPFMDASENGRGNPAPATVSKPIITELLRNRLGYKGLIISDAVDMGGFMGWAPYDERTLDCLRSGMDAILWPGDNYFEMVEAAVSDGRLSKEILVKAATHVLELKARMGLLDGTASLIGAPLTEAEREDAVRIAKSIAEKSVTLVRNRDGLIPLDPQKTKRILVCNMPQITKDRFFPIDRLIDGLKARGIEVGTIERTDPVSVKNSKETIGTGWDALLMPFIAPTHGLINTVRPMGDAARSAWSIQMLDELKPIFISFSTPYLLCDFPYTQTLINCYSSNPYSDEAVIKALFGELQFNETPPVASFNPGCLGEQLGTSYPSTSPIGKTEIGVKL